MLIVGCVFWVYFIGRRVEGVVPFQECVACLYCPPIKIFSNEEICISKETCKENIYWGENNNIYQDFDLLSLTKVCFPNLINLCQKYPQTFIGINTTGLSAQLLKTYSGICPKPSIKVVIDSVHGEISAFSLTEWRGTFFEKCKKEIKQQCNSNVCICV